MMSANLSPLPNEPDVHLSVYLHGVQLDYAACMTAARVFVEQHQREHYFDAVNILPGDATVLQRLPGERLYLGP